MGNFAKAAGMAGMAGAAMTSLNKVLDDMEKERLQEALLKAREQMDIRADERRQGYKIADEKRAEAKLAADNAKVQTTLTGLINDKWAGSDSAVSAADSGETDMPLTSEQRQVISDARSRDRFDPTLNSQALAMSGTLSGKDSVGLLNSIEQRDYQRGRDVKQDERNDKDFALREKQVNATIKASAAAAAERATAKADKEALKAEYELLGHYLSSKATNPSSDYSQQIAASVSKIASLGGNPQVMIDLMLGKETSQTVAVKTGDAKMGEPETTTTKVVKGDRQGGVVSSWKNQPIADGVGAPAGKRVVVNGKEGEYVMKDGKKFFVPYK